MWLVLRRTRRSVVAAAVALMLVAPVPLIAETASSQPPARKTGTVKIKLITPPGVPATVLLRKKRMTVAAAKPAAGKVATSRVKVAPGTWRPTARPVFFEDRYFVPTTSPARAVVRAGRTTTVTVKWKPVPVARRLRVTSMTTTSLRLSFLRAGPTSKVTVRYTAGHTAPKSVKGGKSAAVSGTTVRATGLAAGRPYSFSLFTKVGRKWLGPVPLTATTSAAADGSGSEATYITDPAAVLVPRGTQLGSRQLASGRVHTLLPAGVVPVIGTPVVLPASRALPGGFVGTIVGVAADGKHVTLAQTALATAFDYLKLAAPSLASARVTTTFEPEPKSTGARAGGECQVGGATSVSVEPSFDFGSSSVNVELASKEYLGLTVVKGLKLEARVVADVSASISASISSTYTCSKLLGKSILTFSLGPVPMMLTYSPKLEVQASGRGTLSGAVLNLEAGFEGSLYKPLVGGVDIAVDPVVSTSHTMPTASGLQDTVEVRGRVGGTVALGPGLGNGKLDVRVMAGLTASLFPLDAKIKADFYETTHCVEMSVAGTASASVFAAVWLKGYEIDASWKFWEGSLNYAGPWKAPVPCPGDVDVQDTWRGWAAIETDTPGTPASNQHTHTRTLYVDTDAQSKDAAIRADLYIGYESAGDCPDRFESANTKDFTGVMSPSATTFRDGDAGVPSGEHYLSTYWSTGAGQIPSDQAMTQACGLPPFYGPGLYSGWGHSGVYFHAGHQWPGEQFHAPPVTVSASHDWLDESGNAWRMVTCMTRSTDDTDADGLPDEVDLNPTEPAAALDLGSPGGSALWDVSIPNKYGGPDGVEGLPDCPPVTAALDAVDDTFSAQAKAGGQSVLD